MKTTFYIILTALLLALPFNGTFAGTSRYGAAQTQDERTSIDTIVARMPAETMGEFNALMQELSADGKKTVEILANMLVPATEGQNSKVEYALNGLVTYVSAEGRETLAKEVRSGLCTAIDACADKVNKAFLMTLLQFIGTEDDREKVKELLKIQHLMDSDNSHERFEGLYLLLHSGKVSPQDAVLEALKDSDREYRAAALREAEDFADEGFYGKVAAMVPELGDEAKADVVRWFGDNHVKSQSATVVEATASTNPEVAKAAIKAAGKIGGDDALKALAACLQGSHEKEAVVALTSFNGDVTEVVMSALDSPHKLPALKLAGARHVTTATPKVFELTASEDEETAKAAFKALAGVCTTKDFEQLCTLLDGCAEDNVPDVQAALVVSVRDLTDGEIAKLKEDAFAGSRTAFLALLNIQKNLTAEMLALAGQNEGWKDDALLRLCALMGDFTPAEERAALIVKALELKPSTDAQNSLLTVLGDSHDPVGIGIALGYIDVPETAEASAYAIKTIAGKNAELLPEESTKAALVRARDVYAYLSTINPDAGYAVDEINGMLEK